MTFHDYFDRVFVINLVLREDRWLETLRELEVHGVDLFKVERWPAHHCPTDGHYGCTRSHRELLAHVAQGPWRRVLVLEDDIAVVTKSALQAAGFQPSQSVWRTHCSLLNGEGTLVERFNALLPWLPPAYDLLYLGAGYGEPPISRFNQHVLRVGAMLTTSSYAITREFAGILSENINAHHPTLESHPGPIDSTFGLFAHNHHYYCLQPRLLYQRATLSDITKETNSYLFSMTDPVHEQMV